MFLRRITLDSRKETIIIAPDVSNVAQFIRQRKSSDINLLSWMFIVKDTVTGFILAGIGHRNVEGQNFLIVKPGRHVRRRLMHSNAHVNPN